MKSSKNTVSAKNQVSKNKTTEIFNNSGKINVLFLGNSITCHKPNLSVGWPYNNANMTIGQFWHEGVAMPPNHNGMRQIAERIIAFL